MLSIDLNRTFQSNERSSVISCQASFKEGETTVLFGMSGSGKTTVLRMIAGLDKPDNGTIVYNGVAWYDNVVNVSIKDRTVGMVFQDFNLFENMTVLQNLAYAADGKLPDYIEKLALDLGIVELYAMYPSQLSKGQQQKVAILRMLCVQAEILLLDEPFSALDDDSIVELMKVLEKLKTEFQLTIILVTHRKDVILEMADSVVMISDEKTTQGAPNELIVKSF